MIELLDLKSTKALGIKISGKIEKQDIEKIFAEADEKLSQVDKLAIYVEVDKFGGISFEACIEDVKQGLPKISKFYKKAVVSDSRWHKVLAEFGDKLLPSLEVRHFPPEQREEAITWVIA